MYCAIRLFSKTSRFSLSIATMFAIPFVLFTLGFLGDKAQAHGAKNFPHHSASKAINLTLPLAQRQPLKGTLTTASTPAQIEQNQNISSPNDEATSFKKLVLTWFNATYLEKSVDDTAFSKKHPTPKLKAISCLSALTHITTKKLSGLDKTRESHLLQSSPASVYDTKT